MGFAVTGADHFPSAAYAVLGAGQSSFGSIHIAANGTGPYAVTSSRWGDYSWAVIDPSGQRRLDGHRIHATAREPDPGSPEQLGHTGLRGVRRLTHRPSFVAAATAHAPNRGAWAVVRFGPLTSWIPDS